MSKAAPRFFGAVNMSYRYEKMTTGDKQDEDTEDDPSK